MKRIALIRTLTIGFAALSLYYYVKTAWPSLGQTNFDDSYMFLRYAKHWLSGAGFSWNSAEGPVYGVTSALYLLIITAVRGLTDFADASVLTGVSFLAGLLSCVVLTVLGFLFYDNREFRDSWAPVLVIPCLFLGYLFLYHSLTGMETTLSLLTNSLLACSVVLYSRNQSRIYLILSLLTGYVSFLARPDNGLYSLLLPPLFLTASDRRQWRRSLMYAALFGFILLADLALKKVLLGDFVPLPFFAKSSGFYKGYLGAYKWNAAAEMLNFAIESLPFLLAMTCVSSRKALLQLTVIGLPLLVTFGYYATVTQIMGSNARYYYPSLPFLVLGAFVAINSRGGATEKSSMARHSSLPWRFLVVLTVLLFSLSPMVRNVVTNLWQKHVIGTPLVYKPQRQYMVYTRNQVPALGWWAGIEQMGNLMGHLPPDAVIAASEYGFIGSEHPDIAIVDLVGLQDRYIAHNGFSADYLFSREPDLIWFPHADYSYTIKEIVDSDTFALNYDYYPGAYDYGIAIRKTFAQYPAIQKAVQDEFARVYSGQDIQSHRAEPVVPPNR